MSVAELKIAVDPSDVQAATKSLELLADAANRAREALEGLHDAAARRNIKIAIVGSIAQVTVDGVPQTA